MVDRYVMGGFHPGNCKTVFSTALANSFNFKSLTGKTLSPLTGYPTNQVNW